MNKWLSHTTAAIALLAFTLTGCHDRLRGVGTEPDQGAERTSLTVTLSTEVGAPGSLRGITDAQDTEVPGATGTGEDKVEHLTLAMQPGIFLSSDHPQRVGTTNEYTVLFKDILYPGSIKLSCSVYLGQWLPALSLSDFYADKEVTYDQLKTLTSDTDGFVMTSAVGAETMTLKPGITEPSKGNDNYLAIDVERVVSKGAVSFDKNNIEDKVYRARYAPTTVGVPEAADVISEGVSLSNAILPIGWAAVGGAKSAYLFRNHAGRRTLGSNSDLDAGLYTGLKTLSAVGKKVGSYDLFKLSDYMSMTDDADIDAAKAKPFLFFTEFTGKIDTGTFVKDYNGSGDTSGNNGVSVKGGAYPASPYFLEHALTETSTARTSYPVEVTFSDVAYAKVLTQTKAVRGAMIDESDKSGKDLPFYYKVSSGDPLADQTTTVVGDHTEVTLTTPYVDPSGLRVIRTDPEDAKSSKFYPRRYLVEVSEDWYTANKGKTYPATGELNLGKPAESIYPGQKGEDPYRFVKIIFSDGAEHWFFEVRDRVLDYYVGVNDGNVYNSLLAARAAGNTKSRKYTLGQAYYLVPFNAQRNDAGMIYNCDTRRNNIYDLRITAIEGMGYNYDPVDPTDPYMPKPEDNPDEPDPVVPSVNTSPQKIRVKARILKWNYIHYSADLKAMTGDAND